MIGIYHGATGTVAKIAFTAGIEVGRHKLMPNSSKDGGMARLAYNGRPLPVVYVRMDNPKLDAEIIKDGIVAFVPQQRVVTKQGNNSVYR